MFQTSRALQVCVDEFVRQRATTPLVLKISLRDHYDRYDEEEVRLLLTVLSLLIRHSRDQITFIVAYLA